MLGLLTVARWPLAGQQFYYYTADSKPGFVVEGRPFIMSPPMGEEGDPRAVFEFVPLFIY
jgi:hypothetical protein